MMFFVVHLENTDGDIICKALHSHDEITTYIEQNDLVRDDCLIFDGKRMLYNDCHKKWEQAIIVQCSHCNKDMTGFKHGEFPCDITLEAGCPDKGDGGW